MEKTYTQHQIEQAFLKWWENSTNWSRYEFKSDGRTFEILAKEDAEYLIELINEGAVDTDEDIEGLYLR